MKICGVIAEYNPFHNGHALQLRQARLRSSCDYVIACMSGSFSQRGEAMCMDKWSRARAALLCGADAVFELPALWAVRTADAFARGGVGMLHALGCDALSFGCEIDDLQLLSRMASLRACETGEVARDIREGLGAGMSHARARGEAHARALGMDASLLNAPNLNLAAEYIAAMNAHERSMQCVLVPRVGAYHDEALGEFASASAIRAALARGERDAALCCVPEVARALLGAAGNMHAPDDLILDALRGTSPEALRALPDVAEGLENRLLRCAREASGYEDLIERVKCKRYTRARIARCCAHALLGLTRELIARHPLPEYARLLGMRRDARALLRELDARSTLPIVSGSTALRGNEVFSLDVRASELRALLCSDPHARRAGADFTQKFVLV